MFYSQTFLARKGPLGTVWIAAHMQSRLKKSHYISTDIPSTVDRIMFPEVPLALRMTSHLLLGVVRIYSKQVDFLFDDCNVVATRLRKAFASVDLNLPEDARQAPVQTITLPETFDLDAMDLDHEFNLDRVVDDHHLKNQEDITLYDQVPVDTELYVSITFDEDVFMDSLHQREAPHSSPSPMEPRFVPQASEHNDEGVPSPGDRSREQETPARNFHEPDIFEAVFQDLGPSNTPEIEVTRDAAPETELNTSILSPNLGKNDTAEPQPFFNDQVMNENETNISPIPENNLPSPVPTLIVQSSPGPEGSISSLQDGLVNNKSPISFAIRSTPTVQNPKPKPRPRKRKQLYDEAPVLTNKFMKKALKDTSDLVRKRSKIPQSALGIWKLKSKLLKEQVFTESSITGLCSDLRDMYSDDHVATKLNTLNESHTDTEVIRSPVPREPEDLPHNETTEFQTPTRNNDYAEEIEILRHAVEQNTLPEIIPSPIYTVTPSGRREDEFSAQTFVVSEMGTSQTLKSSLGTVTEMDTPSVFSENDHVRPQHSVLSDVPEVNPEEENSNRYDLSFLEAEIRTPDGKQTSPVQQGLNSLSVRTRALAQYLKRQSLSEDSTEHICLNKLLEGKKRSTCARMFFETTVLKSHGLVDVKQEVPYGDISLKLTQALSKAKL